MVRKKQSIIRRAIAIRKMKLAKVSNPNQLAREPSGSGKIAMKRKTIGSKSQAIEFLIDILFLTREIKMIIKSNNAAIDISICTAAMFFPYCYYDD